MAQSPLSTLNLSRKRLTQLQNTLHEKGDQVRDESARLSAQLKQRSATTAARLRDTSLAWLYEAGNTSLNQAASWMDKFDAAKHSAQQLREVARAAAHAGESVHRPPIADYDDLNVKVVSAALQGLSNYDLEKVRRYEEANKNRVTVLREIDDLLAE